jgi:hypothetical protein
MNLVINLATRGRPEQALQTIKETLPLIEWMNTIFMVSLDDDDKESIEAFSNSPLLDSIKLSIEPREDTVAGKWNRALKIPGDVYLPMADTNPYTTIGFDSNILNAANLFPDRIGMVVGRLVNGSFSGTMAPTAKFCELFGNRIMPEHFPYWFADHWLDDVVHVVGRRVFTNGVTRDERKHTTQELREPNWWAKWFDAGYMIRRKEAFAIIDGMNEPPWRKQVQRSLCPLVERRSWHINEHVRFHHREWITHYGANLNDPRYQRTKARALAMLPEMLKGMPEDEAQEYREYLCPPETITHIANLKVA